MAIKYVQVSMGEMKNYTILYRGNKPCLSFTIKGFCGSKCSNCGLLDCDQYNPGSR